MTVEPRPPTADETSAGKEPGSGDHELSFGARMVLHVLGWLLVAIGVAGAFLPILQGWIFLLLGAAVLSVASDRLHRWMHRRLVRWPHAGERLEHFRERIKGRMRPKGP